MSRRIPFAAWFAALLLLALSMSAARPEAARPAAPTAAPPQARPGAPPAVLPRALPTEDGVEAHTCFDNQSCQRIFRTVRKNPHVIDVPQASGDQLAAAEARDRRWVAHCRPTIRQDAYGMPRYSYAAAGCEYGRLD
jgi:hypothetical protein